MLAQVFQGPEVAWFALSPLIVLVGASLFLLLVGSLTPTWPRGLYAAVTAAAAVVAGVLAIMQWDDISDSTPSTLVARAVAFDTFAQWVTISICIALIGVALITSDHLSRSKQDNPEIYALYLVAAAGGVVMGAANDLIVLFLGLETLSLAFYVLAASDRRRTTSGESGMKYFILGGFSSAFFLYGVALLYGATGTTNISQMVENFTNVIPLEPNDIMLLAGVGLLLVGFAFKVAAAPFHVWSPDVYQGAPTPTTALMASIGKIAAVAALVRVLVVGLGSYRDDWRPVIWVLAVASIFIGSMLAVVQKNVKRMLAYSSVTHAGYILVGLVAAGQFAGEADSGPGVPAISFYLLTYGVIVTGTFAVVGLVAKAGGDDGTAEHTNLDDFRGLGKRHPALALALTVLLMAQAGVPFTSGFVAKFGVIAAAVDGRSYVLAVVAMVGSVIGAYLYLRILVSAWMHDESPEQITADAEGKGVSIPALTGVFVAAAAIFTLFVGIWPTWLLDLADATVNFAR